MAAPCCPRTNRRWLNALEARRSEPAAGKGNRSPVSSGYEQKKCSPEETFTRRQPRGGPPPRRRTGPRCPLRAR
jgi:hypothetical protein